VNHLNIAMISVHSSPLGELGTRDTGGMSVYIRELAAVLGNRGHRVDIYTRPLPGHAPGRAIALSQNVRLVPLAFGAVADAPKRALHPYLDRFFLELEGFRAAANVAYDLIHSHYWLSGLVGRSAQRAWRVPHVSTFHTLGAIKNLVHAAEEEAALRIAAEHDLAGIADRLLVTSRRERDNLLRYYEAAPEKVSTVACGVNLERFQPMDRGIARRRIGADPNEALLLYVGRFASEKGLERLIRAMGCLRQIPRLRLIVVGGDGSTDPTTRQMKALGRRLGAAEAIAFVGRVDQRELPSFYSAADVLVLPSSYESFGMVALEAMACGTPVVATRVGAMEEIIRSGENGHLVDGFNPSSLAEAVAAWLRRGPKPPSGTAAVRRSVWRYDWTRAASEVLKVYEAAAAPAAFGGETSGLADSSRPETEQAACCGCGLAGKA
jgi:D-inositol-3-phosphate glycosyltransferase